MQAVNAVKYELGRREHRRGNYRQGYAAFSFLLDYVPGWKRAYGPQGLMQWQCFVPAAAAPGVFRKVLETCQERRTESLLAVFKRHRADDFLISHGVDGYSLALDFPARWGEDLQATLRALEPLVIEAGGRFYFAKDSCMPEGLPTRYLPPDRLEAFRALKRQHDPGGVLESGLSRRVFGPGGI